MSTEAGHHPQPVFPFAIVNPGVLNRPAGLRVDSARPVDGNETSSREIKLAGLRGRAHRRTLFLLRLLIRDGALPSIVRSQDHLLDPSTHSSPGVRLKKQGWKVGGERGVGGSARRRPGIRVQRDDRERSMFVALVRAAVLALPLYARLPTPKYTRFRSGSYEWRPYRAAAAELPPLVAPLQVLAAIAIALFSTAWRGPRNGCRIAASLPVRRP